MGFWGTGAMDGDGPLDLQHICAAAVAKKLTKALASDDDADVFAAAQIAIELHDSAQLGFDYTMHFDGANLAQLAMERVVGVQIAEEWGETSEREQVRRNILHRLARIKGIVD